MFDFLKGVRVVECSILINGCSLGNFLADAGAEVIKVEPPPAGDYIRDIMGSLAPRQSPVHLQLNKNKRSIMIDLRKSQGRDVFWDLLDTADIFVDGLIAGACDGMGVGYEAQRQRRPGIVYVQFTGYGASGPYAPIPTHGRMMSAAGGKYRVAVGDDGLIRPSTDETGEDGPFEGIVEGAEATWAGAIQGAFYAVAALERRRSTGSGCYLDVSAADAVIASAWHGSLYGFNVDRIKDWTGIPVARDGVPKLVDPSPGPGLDGAKYSFYETQDGRMLLFGCIEHKWWVAFCDLVGRPDLESRHNPSLAVDFAIGDRELYFELREILLTKTREEWLELAASNDLPIGPANVGIPDLLNDRHIRSRNVIVEGTHPHAGEFTYLGPPVVVPDQTYEITRPAPLAGEHSIELLGELGYGEERVRALIDDGAVRSSTEN